VSTSTVFVYKFSSGSSFFPSSISKYLSEYTHTRSSHSHIRSFIMPGLSSYLVSALSLASVALASPIAKAQLVGRDTSLLASYDYVIVGGGTSGLIVADRLTENSSSQFSSP
jgi:hypothetical protein